MASAINDIYDAIAAWDAYHDSGNKPTVRKLQNLKDFTGTPEMPVRILSPLDPETSGTSGHVALDETMIVVWEITDTLLLRPAAHEGSTLREAPQIVNYIKTYLAAIQADRTPTKQSWVESAEWDVGTFTYGDNVEYYGVKFVLEIHEVL